MIVEGQAAGEVVAGDLEQVATVAVATFQGLAAMVNNGMLAAADLDEIVPATVERLLLGLRLPALESAACSASPCSVVSPCSRRLRRRHRRRAPAPPAPSCVTPEGVAKITFSRTKYPNIRATTRPRCGRLAARAGLAPRRRRRPSLALLADRHPARMDRDEYPPAVARAVRADVAYVPSSENRSHGSRSASSCAASATARASATSSTERSARRRARGRSRGASAAAGRW